MFTKLASVLVVASVIGLATTASAGPDRAPASWGGGHGQWRTTTASVPRHRDWAAPRELTLERRIDRRVKNTVLPLRRIFRLGRDYAGYRVSAVIVKLRPFKHRARVKLLVNGRAVDGQTVRRAGAIHLRLDDERTIGRDLRSLKLDICGKMFVKSIKVKLTRLSNRRHAVSPRRSNPVARDIDRRFAELLLRALYNPWRGR